MSGDGSHRAMLQALNDARPDAALSVLSDVFSQQFGARDVRVLLANYELTALRSMLTPDECVLISGTAAGQAFTRQEPTVVPRGAGGAGGAEIYLPVSVHGARVGVLQLVIPGALLEEHLTQLSELATLAGYALTATSRQTDLLHKIARSRRMTLSAELQWQLLPARGCVAPEFELAGHLEPAYTVCTGNFDWSVDDDQLLVSISDAAHDLRGTPLLTTLSVTAARNARRGGLGIADQAAMSDQAVYAHYQGDHSVDTILMSVDLATGRASALKAGSSEIVLLRDGALHMLELTEQIPLGLFEGTEYTEQSIQLATGDRLLLMSARVADDLAPRGRPLSDEAPLLAIAERGTHEHPADVVRSIIDELIAQQGGNELDDDATVLCLDWNGPGISEELTLTDPVNEVRSSRPHLHAVRPDRDPEGPPRPR